MKPGDLQRRNRFFTPGCEWRGEVEKNSVYLYVGESDENWKGWFLGPHGTELIPYMEMMEGVG